MQKLLSPLLFSLVFGQTVAAQKPPKNLRIACNVLENREKDDYEVYSMRPDGTEMTNVSQHPDVAWTYSAWGERLFWISDRDTCPRCYFLYESRGDGSETRKIGGLRLEDSWLSARKKGSELIVSGRIGKEIRHQLFLMDAKTGQSRQLSMDTAARFNDPVFSPDGKKIAYRFKKNRRDRDEKMEIWIADADDLSNPRQLTFYPQNDTSAQWHSYHAGPPQWNAKENFISFQSLQRGKYRLMAVRPNGGEPWEIHDFGKGAGWHSWSPDGRWLAVELFENDAAPADIYLFDYRKKRLFQLTNTPEKREQSPVWVKMR